SGTIEQGTPSGGRRVYNLMPGGVYNVFVKKESFKNPFIVPKMTEFSFVAEPNAYKNIDVPCYMTGIIEGIVLRVDGTDTSGQGGVKVHIVNNETKDEVTVPVFSDGSFYKSGILPGNYNIYVDSMQLRVLDCEPQPPFIDFEVRSLADGDYVTGLGFAIYPKTISKNKSAKPFVKAALKDSAKTPYIPKSKSEEKASGKYDKNKIETAEPTKVEPKIIKEKTFYYKFTKDTSLSKELREYLDLLSQHLKNNIKFKVYLTGYTDNFSTPEGTLDISNRRCRIVEEYLISTAIDKGRIISKGMGSTNPIGDNSKPEGREKNRRIVIKIE
ncbi:MAG: OmpA family protein, partial [Bacteroidetes bacterium]|nr:OmpA family protein [Bacteroidota bacterium]